MEQSTDYTGLIIVIIVIALVGLLIWGALTQCWLSHTWTPLELEDQERCIWVKRCIKCNEEKRFSHNYILKQKNEKCEIYAECLNCKDIQLVSVGNHVYKELPRDKNCEIYKECVDCKYRKNDYERVEHSFIESWGTDHGKIIRNLYLGIKNSYKESFLKDLYFYTDNNYEETKNLSSEDSVIYLLNKLLQKNELKKLLLVNKSLSFVKSIQETINDLIPEKKYLYLSEKFWQNENIYESCTIEVKCTNCGIKTYKKFHTYIKSDFLEPNKCDKITYCVKCASINNYIVEHDWTVPIYESSKSCRQFRKCERCKEVEKEIAEVHQWNNWEYKNDKSCQKKRYCLHCEKLEETTQEQHNWEDRKHGRYINGTYFERTYKACTRCGKTDGYLY